MTPQRIQRKRERGWRWPEGAVYVGRPSIWGNPYRVGETVTKLSPLFPYLARTLPGSEHPRQWGRWSFDALTAYDVQSVVDAYGWWLPEQPTLMVSLPELAGRALVCWCPLDQPCHADVLLSLANDA